MPDTAPACWDADELEEDQKTAQALSERLNSPETNARRQ